MSLQGKLIVFEGPDGCGKTTLANKVAARFGDNVLYSPFPNRGSGTLGEIVYKIHHNSLPLISEPISATALQALHVATHLDSVKSFLKPKLDAGITVFLDRFWWSTWAYARAFEADMPVVEALLSAEKMVWGSLTPTHMFVIRRRVPFREEYPQYWEQLNSAYDTIIHKERGSHPITTILNDAPVEQVVESIERECRQYFNEPS